MSLYSLFSKVKQQMGFQQNDSVSVESCNAESTLNCTIENQDSDEEDYLLVSVSAKKAKTEAVTHPEIIPNQNNVLNGDCTIVSGTPEYHRNEMLLHNPSSPVSDIPFTLHADLHAHLQVREMFKHISLEPCVFNYLKYSHDFTNEKLCLRDMNSNEMADIDEFLMPSGESQTSTHIPSRNGEVNLMLF